MSSVVIPEFFQGIFGLGIEGTTGGITQPASGVHQISLLLAILCSLMTLAVLAAIWRFSRWEMPESFLDSGNPGKKQQKGFNGKW
jgi:hypothetical protein